MQNKVILIDCIQIDLLLDRKVYRQCLDRNERFRSIQIDTTRRTSTFLKGNVFCDLWIEGLASFVQSVDGFKMLWSDVDRWFSKRKDFEHSKTFQRNSVRSTSDLKRFGTSHRCDMSRRGSIDAIEIGTSFRTSPSNLFLNETKNTDSKIAERNRGW